MLHYGVVRLDIDNVKSNKIHQSQLKLFVENERPKDPQNTSITTHAGAVVDVNFYASYEVQPSTMETTMLLR
jgi:hypothetical protein